VDAPSSRSDSFFSLSSLSEKSERDLLASERTVAYRPGGRGGQLPPGAAVEGAQNRAKVGFMQLLNKPKVAYSFTIVNLLGSTSL